MKKEAELTKTEVDQLNLRSETINRKQKEANELIVESQIFQRELNIYVKELYEKYGLDVDKKYTFDGSKFFLEEKKKEEKKESKS